jgi:nitrate reductase gamma subunit
MTSENADRQWFIAGRWQEFEGESRANLLRVAGIALFYLIELLNRTNVAPAFHEAMTALAAAWVLTSWAVFICLKRRVFPDAMKFLSTGVDLLLLTCLLLLADGPRSPLLVGYFFILCLAALRFSVNLVRFATAGAIVSYIVVFRQALWMRPDVAISRNHEFIVLLALLLCGTALGQILRRVRAFAEDYARRLAESR